LTAFLIPLEAGEAQKREEIVQDAIDIAAGSGEGSKDDVMPEPPAARRAFSHPRSA
jgi:hypothetical protein